MKYFLMLFLLALDSKATIYKFEQLLDIALKNDVATEIEKTKALELEARIKQQKADFYPQLSFVVGSEKREAKSEPDVSKNNFVGEFRVNYNLYRFGETSNNINALEELKRQQDKMIEISKIKMRQNLLLEFNETLYLKEKLTILNEELKFNNQLKEQVAKKVNRGLVGKADILEIDMREATIKLKILEADEEFQHGLDNLRKIAKLEHDEKLELVGEIAHEHFQVNIDDLIKAAYNNNSEYLLSQAEMNASLYELESVKTYHLPEINLNGRYGRMRIDEQYADDSLEGLVGVYVTIPLFSGGKNSANVDMYKSILARERLKYNSNNHNLKIDVIHYYEKMVNIHTLVDLSEKNLKNSKNYFENVNQEYIRGLKNSLDLVSARDRMIDFKINYSNAKKEFIKAKTKLEEVVGVSFN